MKKAIVSLDPLFLPLYNVYKEFEAKVNASPKQKQLTICLERPKGFNYFFELKVFEDSTEHDEENYQIVERIVKSILWIVGGHTFKIAESSYLTKRLQEDYSLKGKRKFDYEFMTGVYEKPLTFVNLKKEELPKPNSEKKIAAHHLDGYRIGFDAGGSDRKVSAIIDGKVVFSEETVWFPKIKDDPGYHLEGVLESLNRAASFLPRVDAIGISSAGVCVDNKLMVSSLFVNIPKEKYEKAKNIYNDAVKKFPKASFVLANDGDVTAYAGSLELGVDKLLGIAMGTSEAGGYIGPERTLNGWLSELAFVPVDVSPKAMADEWSGDLGCGVKYFSQDGVIKLAKYAGIKLEEDASPARKLSFIQDLAEKNDPKALEIFENIGTYLAYGIAYYTLFYEIDHVLLLGRVVSGKGGNIIFQKAQETLNTEFSDIKSITLHLPDESSRRVGQSIAAAGLPKIK